MGPIAPEDPLLDADAQAALVDGIADGAVLLMLLLLPPLEVVAHGALVPDILVAASDGVPGAGRPVKLGGGGGFDRCSAIEVWGAFGGGGAFGSCFHWKSPPKGKC